MMIERGIGLVVLTFAFVPTFFKIIRNGIQDQSYRTIPNYYWYKYASQWQTPSCKL